MSISSIGSTPPVSFTGIASGLNTTQIISAYLQIDEAPMLQLENQQSGIKAQIAAYQSLQAQVQSLQSAAENLSSPQAFSSAVKATSTDTTVATATAAAGAAPASVTFSVDQLATADTLISSGTVASANDVVASGSLLVAAGGAGLGIGSLSGSGLASGAHSIAVTQAASGASITGAKITNPTTITASNNQLIVTLDNGQTQTYLLTEGNYNPQQLAAQISTASGGALVGTIDSSGQLVVTSADQGSTATLQIGSGSANSVLGLSAGASATGTNGVITVDGQANTISTIAGNGSTSVTLTSGAGGTVTAQLNGSGLSIGSITAQNVSVGNGSLSSVVAAINNAGTGVTAQALEVGANAYALELGSTQTGAANDVTIDPAAFSGSSLGTMQTTTAGQDAIVSLGGTGGYQVSSSTNTFANLLQGVTVQVAQTSSAPVTVSVQPDGQAAANLVQGFVDAANTVLSTIAGDTAYNQVTNTSGILNGQYGLQGLTSQILATVGQVIGSSNVADSGTAGSAAGLSLGNGTINFDAATFAADYAANPSAVAKMFTQGGSFSPASGSPASAGDVSLVYASDATQPGSYAVDLTQSATQATDTGTVGYASGSTLSTGAGYTVTSGSASATYAAQAGQTLSQVASGLDAAFAAAGLSLSAQVVAGQSGSVIQLASAAYGAGQSFTVSASGGDPLGLGSASPFAGSDVAGTIDGVAATGSGQVLSAPVGNSTLGGLSLQVQTAGVSSQTPVQLGTYSYQPGMAQGLASLASQAIAPSSGQLTTAISQLQADSSALGSQITLEQQIVAKQFQALQSEYTNLEQTLSTLKSESAYLTSAFGTSASGSLVSALAGSGSSTSGSSTGTGG